MTQDERPFLTVVAFPDGLDRRGAARWLADETGMDEPTLRLRLGKEPPTIVGQVEPDQAMRAVHALVKHGGDAFAATLADLARLGSTMKIKDLRIEDGNVAVDLWQGPSAVIRREDVQILVRAQLSTKFLESSRLGSARSMMPGTRGLGPDFGGLGLGGAGILAATGANGLGLTLGMGYMAALEGYASRADVTVSTSDKLDIHTRGGQVFQVDGDKFGYRVLGDMRGYGDKYNMDRLCDLLAHICPDEIVDPYFSLWHAPPGVERLRLRPRDDSPAFAFYSRWAALMYRHVLGA